MDNSGCQKCYKSCMCKKSQKDNFGNSGELSASWQIMMIIARRPFILKKCPLGIFCASGTPWVTPVDIQETHAYQWYHWMPQTTCGCTRCPCFCFPDVMNVSRAGKSVLIAVKWPLSIISRSVLTLYTLGMPFCSWMDSSTKCCKQDWRLWGALCAGIIPTGHQEKKNLSSGRLQVVFRLSSGASGALWRQLVQAVSSWSTWRQLLPNCFCEDTRSTWRQLLQNLLVPDGSKVWRRCFFSRWILSGRIIRAQAENSFRFLKTWTRSVVRRYAWSCFL